jgi:hypothetical protein
MPGKKPVRQGKSHLVQQQHPAYQQQEQSGPDAPASPSYLSFIHRFLILVKTMVFVQIVQAPIGSNQRIGGEKRYFVGKKNKDPAACGAQGLTEQKQEPPADGGSLWMGPAVIALII